MSRMLRLTSVLVLAAFALAACDDNDNGDDNGNAGGGDPQDRFGAAFAEAFNADPNGEPIDPQPGDASEGSSTGDPGDF